MVRRLLEALEYPEFGTINLGDQNNFRKLIVWLESNKLNKATPELQVKLKDLSAADWNDSFSSYATNLGCPTALKDNEKLRWLLGLAVQEETKKNRDVYIKHTLSNIQKDSTPSVVAENPLDKLDLRSKEFEEGINRVAKLLAIIPHPDVLITLKAVSKVISTRLSPEILANQDKFITKGTPFQFSEVTFGADLSDPVLNDAAKILRLLYIHDLRDLQTKTNELIVAAQIITANPKTDTKLGKVGI